MTVHQTGIQANNLVFSRGQAQLQQSCLHHAAEPHTRIGIQKDGQLVLFRGRSYLLHPHQTQRATAFLQSLSPTVATRSPRLDTLQQASLAAMQARHAILRSLLQRAQLLPASTMVATARPIRPGGPAPATRPTPGWAERLQHAAARIRTQKTAASAPPSSPVEQAKRQFLDRLSQDADLAQSIRSNLVRFASDLAQASAAETAGLFRVPLAQTDLTQMYQTLTRKQCIPVTLNLHQRAHLIKTLLAPFKLSAETLPPLPAQAIFERQRDSLQALLTRAPTVEARATHAAVCSAFQALAQAYRQASPLRTHPFNQSSIGVQAILFDITQVPADAALADKAAAVLAYWATGG